MSFDPTKAMAMQPFLKLPVPDLAERARPDNGSELSVEMRNALNWLRMAAMNCRSAARTDLFEACALLHVEGEVAKRTYVDTLVKCLSKAIKKPVLWHGPGIKQVSFDEHWILRCIETARENDLSSLSFLLRSRVAPADRRYIGFLVTRVSEQFSRI